MNSNQIAENMRRKIYSPSDFQRIEHKTYLAAVESCDRLFCTCGKDSFCFALEATGVKGMFYTYCRIGNDFCRFIGASNMTHEERVAFVSSSLFLNS